MATYREIQEDVFDRTGKTVKTCWIAHVKALQGLTTRQAHNRHDSTQRAHPCPSDRRAHIEASLRRFGMLPR